MQLLEGNEEPHVVKHKEIMKYSNYVKCMLVSFLVSDTGNFKSLILVDSVQRATAEQFKSTIFNSCPIRDCSGPLWYSKGEVVPTHAMKAYRRVEVQLHRNMDMTTRTLCLLHIVSEKNVYYCRQCDNVK
jgi:hypothetical protein